MRRLLAAPADPGVGLRPANIVVFRGGDGVVLLEPPIVAVERTARVRGVETTGQMLRHFIRSVSRGTRCSGALVCIPRGLTQVGRNATIAVTTLGGMERRNSEPLTTVAGGAGAARVGLASLHGGKSTGRRRRG